MGFGSLFLSSLQGIIWQCFFVMTVSTQVTEDKITCTIPPVEPSQDTVLTCHFPEDLSATKKDFTIYHYVEHRNPESVVDCWWLNGAMDCLAKRGFTYDKVVSRTLNITISHQTNATGKYACQVAGYASNLLETCELISRRDDKISCTIPPVKPFHDTTLTCYFPEDLSVTKKDFTVYHYTERGNPDSVVDCWWLSGAVDCYTKPGFVFTKVVSRTLNVTVSHVTKAAGKYACQVAGYASNLLKTCQFTFKHGGNNTCYISKNQSDFQGTLTCLFNEDIQKTQRNFTVYQHHGKEKRSVLHCWWSNGSASCHVTENYHFNKEVSYYLQVKIPNTTNEGAGIYSCWHEGSKADQVQTCFFNTDYTPSKTMNPSVIGISLGVSAAVILLIIGFVVVMTYRFCFSSTKQNADTLDSPFHEQLPNTEAVFVTGNDFEPNYLYTDILQLLDEPRVFLVGPPSASRTYILCHVGRKWITEGHVVYLINTRSTGDPATTQLQDLMKQTCGSHSQASPTKAHVITLLCGIEDDKKINDNINRLVKCSKKKILCAIVEDLAPETKEQEENVKIFFTKLYERLPNLRLWAASSRFDIAPPGWRGKPLPTFPCSLPPVIRKPEHTEGSGSTIYSNASNFI